MNMDYMVKIVFLLPVVGAMVIFLFSCEELTQSGEDENNSNTEDLVPQVDSIIVDRFAARYQENVESGVTVWMELVDSSAIQGNIRAEIFESPAEDSIWMDYSGVQPIEGEILHTVTARDGNRIVFAPDNRLGNEFKPPSVLEGFKYLVHVYSDEDDFKIYWTFTTKSPDMGFTFTDTLMMHEDQPVDGKTVYLKIVEHSTVEGDGEGALTGIDFGDIEDPAVYWTSATMRDDSVSMMLNGEVEWADFSISGIAQGDYSLWAFIDMNGNATNDNSTTPDSGDLWKGVENFGFYSREIVSEWKHLLNELAWQQY